MTTSVDRFVAIGSLGESWVGTDLLVVEAGVAERRVMRRLYSNVSGRRDVLEGLRQQQQSSTREPRILEIAPDAEGRLCVIFRDFARMPWELARPRNQSEAALLAHDVLRTVTDNERTRDYIGRSVDVDVLFVDLHGVPGLRTLWPPRIADATWQSEKGDAALIADIVGLVSRLGFGPVVLAHHSVRGLEDALRRMIPHARPPRWSPPMMADARRLLDVLTDADQKEPDRIVAAYRLATVPSLVEELTALLVHALNEPLPRLPFVARELLADRLVPIPLHVDRSTGLLRKCPHEWATTEIVEELGGATVERFCPDCDAPVTLPQTLEAFAGRCAVADLFVEQARMGS